MQIEETDPALEKEYVRVCWVRWRVVAALISCSRRDRCEGGKGGGESGRLKGPGGRFPGSSLFNGERIRDVSDRDMKVAEASSKLHGRMYSEYARMRHHAEPGNGMHL